MTLLEGHFHLADDNVVKRMEYNDSLKQLIESIKPEYVHLKYDKIGFNEHNKVAAIDTAVDLEDLAAGDTLVLRKQTPISRTWQPAYRAH